MLALTYTPIGFIHPDDPGEPGTGSARVSLPPVECGIIARVCHAKRVLEVGTGLGVVTRALIPNVRALTTIDIDPWVQRTIWPALQTDPTLRDYGSRVTYRADWPAIGTFDVAVIDGDHRTEAVQADIAHCRRLSIHWALMDDWNQPRVRAGVGSQVAYRCTDRLALVWLG